MTNTERNPCGHKITSVSTSDEGTSYCKECEDMARNTERKCEDEARELCVKMKCHFEPFAEKDDINQPKCFCCAEITSALLKRERENEALKKFNNDLLTELQKELLKETPMILRTFLGREFKYWLDLQEKLLEKDREIARLKNV